MKLYGLIVALLAAGTDNTTNKGDVKSRVFDDLNTLHSMAVAMKGGENSSEIKNLVSKKENDFSMADFEQIFDAVRNITKNNVESSVLTASSTIQGYLDDIDDCFKDFSYDSPDVNTYKTEYDAASGEKDTADGLISVYTTANDTECEDVVSSCSTRDTEGLALYDAMVTSIGCSEPAVPGPEINYDENFVFKSANTIASDIKTKHTNWKNAKATCDTETTKCNTASNNLNEANTNASTACSTLEAKKVAGMNAYDGCFDPKNGALTGFAVSDTFTPLQTQILALETLICTIYPAVETLLDTDDTTNTMPNGGNVACALTERPGEEPQSNGLLHTSSHRSPYTDAGHALLHKKKQGLEGKHYAAAMTKRHGSLPKEINYYYLDGDESETLAAECLIRIGATTQDAVDTWTGDDYRNTLITWFMSKYNYPLDMAQDTPTDILLQECYLTEGTGCLEGFGFEGPMQRGDGDLLRKSLASYCEYDMGELLNRDVFNLVLACRQCQMPTNAPPVNIPPTTTAPDYQSGPQTTEAPATEAPGEDPPEPAKASLTSTGDYVCTCTADGETLYTTTYDFHVDNFTLPTKDTAWTELGCDVGENDGDDAAPQVVWVSAQPMPCAMFCERMGKVCDASYGVVDTPEQYQDLRATVEALTPQGCLQSFDVDESTAPYYDPNLGLCFFREQGARPFSCDDFAMGAPSGMTIPFCPCV